MSDMSVTIGLLLVLAVLGWLVYRVVTTLQAGKPSSKRADYAALGCAPAEDRSDMPFPDHKAGITNTWIAPGNSRGGS